MRRTASGLYRPDVNRATPRMVYGLIILIVMAIVALAIYMWRQQEINQLRGQVSDQSNQINSLQKEITALKSSNTAQPQPQQSATQTQYTSKKGVTLRVYVPSQGATVTSPVAVVGEVPGNWSFEASFPIKLLDKNGKVVAQVAAQLLGDWMTDQLVPFSAKLTYSSGAAASGDGTLVLQKDNPSGLSSNDDSLSIPVKLP